jgi:hypothetical protein
MLASALSSFVKSNCRLDTRKGKGDDQTKVRSVAYCERKRGGGVTGQRGEDGGQKNVNALSRALPQLIQTAEEVDKGAVGRIVEEDARLAGG